MIWLGNHKHIKIKTFQTNTYRELNSYIKKNKVSK